MSVPTRDVSPPVGRADGLSGTVRDALSGSRSTTDRNTLVDRAAPYSRTTYGRPSTDDRTADPVIDLRPASSPAPQRTRFPRSYTAGQRDRHVETERAERSAALDRERLYAARISGRDSAIRSAREAEALDRTTRSRADRATPTRTEALDRATTDSRAAKASPDRPRLSDRRVEQAAVARADRASAAERVSETKLTERQTARKNQIAKDARDAHRARAKIDSEYSDRVRADAKASRFATEVALNAGLSLGVSLGGGWSADFGLYTDNGYNDDCYRPSWCSYPSDDSCWNQWAWSACWWWYRPYYPYYGSSYCYAGWWYPWTYGYWGTTYVQTEVVYVDSEAAPYEEEVVPAGGASERAPGADSDALRRSAGRYLQLGDDAFQLGQYGRAVHYYAKAIELSPDDGVLYLVLSDALFATGDYHYAAYALRRALELEPGLAQMEFDKRDLYSDPNEFDKQLGQLELYIDDHFLDEDARLLLAANYFFSGAPGRALDFLEDPFSLEVLESHAGLLLFEAAAAMIEEN